VLQEPGEAGRTDAWRAQQRQQSGRHFDRRRGEVRVQGVVTRSCKRIDRSACMTSP
jgi:hypothetical protein